MRSIPQFVFTKHIVQQWDNRQIITVRESLVPEFIEIDDAREHCVQATRRRCMQQAEQFMIVYWEEFWWAMSHPTAGDPMTPVPEAKLQRAADEMKKTGRFGVLVYQVEALCVPRLTLP